MHKTGVALCILDICLLDVLKQLHVVQSCLHDRTDYILPPIIDKYKNFLTIALQPPSLINAVDDYAGQRLYKQRTGIQRFSPDEFYAEFICKGFI